VLHLYCCDLYLLSCDPGTQEGECRTHPKCSQQHLPHRVHSLKFLFLGNVMHFHSINAAFDVGVKWQTHVSLSVMMQQEDSRPFFQVALQLCENNFHCKTFCSALICFNTKLDDILWYPSTLWMMWSAVLMEDVACHCTGSEVTCKRLSPFHYIP
jgi:hypothetical protein